MKLVRNTTKDGKCKYALVRLDKIRAMSETLHPENIQRQKIEDHLLALQVHGVLEYAGKGDPEEAFVIKLKDQHAPDALQAYARSVRRSRGEDSEYANEVADLADRSMKHPDRKQPD